MSTFFPQHFRSADTPSFVPYDMADTPRFVRPTGWAENSNRHVGWTKRSVSTFFPQHFRSADTPRFVPYDMADTLRFVRPTGYGHGA